MDLLEFFHHQWEEYRTMNYGTDVEAEAKTCGVSAYELVYGGIIHHIVFLEDKDNMGICN